MHRRAVVVIPIQIAARIPATNSPTLVTHLHTVALVVQIAIVPDMRVSTAHAAGSVYRLVAIVVHPRIVARIPVTRMATAT